MIHKFREGLIKKLLQEWRWIFRYMKRFPWHIGVYIFLGIVGTLLGLGGTVASKYLIDAVTGQDSGSIGMIAALYVGVGMLTIVTNAFTRRIAARVQNKVFNEIRADIFNRIMKTNWESVADYHSGDLLNRANNDAEKIADVVLTFIPDITTGSARFFGALAIILYYDPIMALISFAGVPFFVLTSRFLMHRMRKFQMEFRKISSEIMAFNAETFQNIQFIKSFDLIAHFSKHLQGLLKKSFDTAMKYNLFSIGTTSVVSFIGRMVSYSSFGWSIYRLWHGDITFGTMTLFLQLSGLLTAAFSSLVETVPTIMSAGISARRIIDIVDLPQEDRRMDTEAAALMEKARVTGISIQLQNASFSYKNGYTVFDSVDLHASPGEIVALVGPSGQGKTTILRILLGLVNLNDSTAEISPDGDPSMKLPIGPSTRGLFTYVPQGNMLFTGSVAENLRLVKPDATDEELVNALKAACIDSYVLNLPNGLASMIGEQGHGFSEGQAQRISIARALLSDAPVLLLDEATSALDIDTERTVLRNVMKHDSRKTVIVTTHRPSVLNICTRIYRVGDKHVSLMDKEESLRSMEDF
jgi:ABC-type multidrug transport system fused ATPase/permease subunit